MLLIFSKILVVFIYIGVGFAANRLNVVPGSAIKPITNLIMDITVPCLMISSITGKEVDAGLLTNTLLVIIIGIAIYVVVEVLTTLLSDRVFARLCQPDRNVLASAMTGCNSGFMGYPVSRSVFGAQIFYYVVIQTIANNIYILVMSLAQFHHRENAGQAKRSIRDMARSFTNMASIATIVSVVMLFAGIRPPAYLMDILTTIGDITIPLSMMLVGVQLGTADFARLIGKKELYITSFIKLIAAPALVTAMMTPLGIDPAVKLTLVLCTCFPSAALGVAVAEKEGMNSQLMAEAVSMTTLLSMVTLPVWIMICQYLYVN